MWPFKKKLFEPAEIALVEFACEHRRCEVHRDADDRPYVVILNRAIRLDDPIVLSYKDVIWVKRREPKGTDVSYDARG